jgi:leucyl aminopeptidase (aminopeptidase T)
MKNRKKSKSEKSANNETAQMIKGAQKILSVCASVKSGEEVLIIADDTKVKISNALAAAALRIGAEPVITYLVTRERDGQEPPQAVAEAMKKAPVFLAPVSKSITHTQAVKEAVQAGARGIMLTQFRDDMLIHGGIEADFRSIAPVCEALARRFEEGRSLHLGTKSGTDMTMNIEGRPGNALTCIVKPGQFSPVPNIEANVSPVEESAEGTLIIDASIPYVGIGVLSEPIEIDVKSGFIKSIKGGEQARKLEDNLKGFNDPLVFNIAELGFGLNPYSRLTGCMLDDEGVLRTAHIGIGTNITLGGKIKASCHYDLLLWDTTVTIDGNVVICEGELQI